MSENKQDKVQANKRAITWGEFLTTKPPGRLYDIDVEEILK